jgi:hypothetical protein
MDRYGADYPLCYFCVCIRESSFMMVHPSNRMAWEIESCDHRDQENHFEIADSSLLFERAPETNHGLLDALSGDRVTHMETTKKEDRR